MFKILAIAAGIDAHSSHPLAKAVVAYARENNISIPEAVEFQSVSGRGAIATVKGIQYLVGNHRFAHETGICSAELEQMLQETESQGLSVMVVGRLHADLPGEALGLISVGDTIRAHASEAVRALHQSGVEKIIILRRQSGHSRGHRRCCGCG